MVHTLFFTRSRENRKTANQGWKPFCNSKKPPIHELYSCVRPAGDCQDADATTNPDAAELCDGTDNNCDGSIDEGVESTFYTDSDGDGHGDANSPTLACSPPLGTVSSADDCNDTDPTISPDGLERCNSLDDDCDGSIDEDALDARLWYADSDQDGYGDATQAQSACDVPANFTADFSDCDDSDADIHPYALEWCDGLDNDCDSSIDEDPVDPADWYADADGDGFGNPAILITDCSAPSGFVADNTDCNDANAAYYPGAPEPDCTDPEDYNCDGSVAWADNDSDGAAACEDCDDADASSFLGGTEVCDGRDNDCNGQIDDGAAQAPEWYADADGDGLGDPASPQTACTQPLGYVANADDCDDTVYSGDLDSDGIEDCEDPDIDGDGLRNEWDADAMDNTVVHGPYLGLGIDGSHTVSGTETQSDWTLLSGGASVGTTAIALEDASFLSEGNELILLSQAGSDAGSWTFVFVAEVLGNIITIEPPIPVGFDSNSIVLAQRVPHYTDLSIPVGSTLTADPWQGAGGGVVALRVSGNLDLAGTLDLSGLGFQGGNAGCPEASSGQLCSGGGTGGNGGGYEGCNLTRSSTSGGGLGGNGGNYYGVNGTGGGGGYETGGGGGGGGPRNSIAGASGGDGLI